MFHPSMFPSHQVAPVHVRRVQEESVMLVVPLLDVRDFALTWSRNWQYFKFVCLEGELRLEEGERIQ